MFEVTPLAPREGTLHGLMWTLGVCGAVRSRLPIATLAVLAALWICSSTGLIGGWGRWYSHDMAYRRQTESMLRGEAAISQNVGDLSWDMAWAQGGVQQVWGLGVPIWRLAFELAARAVGQPAFPDRLALAAAIGASAYLLIASLLPPGGLTSSRHWLQAATAQPERLIAALILLAFPPILGLCSGPVNVYEEPVVYGYYYTIALWGSCVAFQHKATVTRFVINGLFAGLIGFVRPTLFVYGIAATLAGVTIARRQRWSLVRTSIAPILLTAGGSTLFASNVCRFGNGFEFGHRLNATGSDIMYASRFEATFDEQPYWRRTLEVLGALYFVKELNGDDNFQWGVMRWQTPAPRWRHFYSRTFDASHLVIWAGAVLSIASNAVLRRQRGERVGYALGALSWIILPAGVLTAFYAEYYSISSRYMLDFAPALAIAATAALLAGGRCLTTQRTPAAYRWALAVTFTCWWAAELAVTRNVFPQQSPWGQIHVIDAMNSAKKNLPTLPSHYSLGSESWSPWNAGIEFNGLGWEPSSGATGPVIMLFVENPAELRLRCRWASHSALTQSAVDCIRAKIGLETLELTSAKSRAGQCELIFAGPVRRAYTVGIHPLFISFAPAEDILATRSPWRLERVDWRPTRRLRPEQPQARNERR